ncbi:hypothetical protein TNIN_191401 [Trichonephila inaurata madagascariensis]|uniref:Uncharacterized protein n=1 Tax=Trichonephila inaurata madagascariensis TaxID=2747483 RepID=A0A8X6I522_9ARAC|nr:hypothetical protein TNIN_191401 [Trichonephila inaurata madagascariensis]
MPSVMNTNTHNSGRQFNVIGSIVRRTLQSCEEATKTSEDQYSFIIVRHSTTLTPRKKAHEQIIPSPEQSYTNVQEKDASSLLQPPLHSNRCLRCNRNS